MQRTSFWSRVGNWFRPGVDTAPQGGDVNTGTQDVKWSAFTVPMTAYVFASIVYFIFCFGMSQYSVSLEKKLATGHKR